MKVLFYISKKYSIPIILPLIDYAQNHNIDFAFYTSRKVEKELKKFDFTILNSITETKRFLPNFVIVPGNFVDFRIPGIKVEIFHGIGVEKKSHFKIRHFFDLYCTSGPFVTEKFIKLQKKYRYFLVAETGWPKIDYILNYPANDIKKRYNIPKDKKVILYAPTHSKKMQSAIELLPEILNYKDDSIIWFVKFHELMSKEIKELVKEKDSIRLITDYDITPYLHLADLMISDTSSVIYEFMVLNKPVITYNTLSRFDKGINIKDKKELKSAIQNAFENPKQFKLKREKHLSEINPYLDGNTAERIFDALKNYQPPKKKKPLNLVRKLQILYHSKFKKGYLR